MVGQATKYYLSAAVLGALAALAYGLPSYRFFGTILLGAAALAFIVLFAISVSAGDPASADREIEHRRPTSNAWWPVLTAFGFALIVLGLVVDSIYTYGGMLLIGLSAIEWTVSAWADRHSDDPVANKAERDRLMRPIEVPVFAVLAIGVPVFLLSRLLLAISIDAAAYAAIGISVAVLGIAFVIYALPGVRREVMTSLLAVGGIALLVGGVIAMTSGEREFEHHVDEHAEEAPEGGEGTDTGSTEEPDTEGVDQTDEGTTDTTGPEAGAEGGEEGTNPATEPEAEGGPEAGDTGTEGGSDDDSTSSEGAAGSGGGAGDENAAGVGTSSGEAA
jgi:hypothetical protein